MPVEEELESLVRKRARALCEYCRYSEEHARAPFQIDHVIAQKHGGQTVADNLALSCYSCNSYKGPNVAGVDPQSRRVVRLFHPRRDRWAEHFKWDGPMLESRTAIGRTTIEVLCINHPLSIEKRRWLIEAGLFPPE